MKKSNQRAPRALRPSGDNSGCSQGEGSNFCTGCMHQRDSDLRAQGSCATRSSFHPSGSTPVGRELLWKSVPTEDIHRIAAEDDLLERLRAAIPESVRITLLADRGFGNQDCYSFLEALGIDYIIRFKESVLVTSRDGTSHPEKEYVPKNGRAAAIPNAGVTMDRKLVAQVVCKRAPKMKQAWCLASSRGDLLPSEILNVYSRRFTIEERFRDTKTSM